MDVTCPVDYSCTFTLLHPRVVSHTLGPWYQHTTGWIVALVAVLVLGAVLAYATTLAAETHRRRDAVRERETERAHQLALEEQRTMQVDAAKGDPEMLKLIRERV